jgi:phage FluMu protein Com
MCKHPDHNPTYLFLKQANYTYKCPSCGEIHEFYTKDLPRVNSRLQSSSPGKEKGVSISSRNNSDRLCEVSH